MTLAHHAPVLCDEVVAALAPINNGIYVDGTFGGGGYARAILGSANTRVVGIDRDPTAIARAAEWAPAYGGRLTLVESPFADMEVALARLGHDSVNGITLDLGVSSMQLDEAERGFSFRFDGPLSMRMDGGKPDAADLIATAPPEDLAAIFKVFGEERHAGRISRAIARERDVEAITTTSRLAKIVADAMPKRGPHKIHPATRVFQAIRIFVNNELGQLARALCAAERLLAPAGRLAVVTFHSLEDRIVKTFLAEASGKRQETVSRHAPPVAVSTISTFQLLTAKPETPGEAELSENPRSRSAKLRTGIRTDQPARDAIDISRLLPRIELSKTLEDWSYA